MDDTFSLRISGRMNAASFAFVCTTAAGSTDLPDSDSVDRAVRAAKSSVIRSKNVTFSLRLRFAELVHPISNWLSTPQPEGVPKVLEAISYPFSPPTARAPRPSPNPRIPRFAASPDRSVCFCFSLQPPSF